MNLSINSQLNLYPLTIRQDKKHYIVEDSLSGDFFEMPKICIDAINMINNGESLVSIQQELKLKNPDEDVDLVEFAEQLLDLGLIKEIDGEAIQVTKKNQTPTGFKWISPQVGRLFFNRVTIKLYIAIIFINIFLIVLNPKLLPGYRDIFLFEAMTLNILTYMGISLLFIIIHEFGHILAVRAHNMPAKLEIGHRLLFIVFETDLTTAWKLKPKQRNVLYLAGICFDQLILFSALSLKLLYPENSILTGFLAIVILDLFIKFIYQCCFYMKTDLYYVLENMTGCYNLMENGRDYLSNWIPFMKKDSTTEAFEGEGSVIRIYSLFYILGLLFTFCLFGFYFVPQAFYAYAQTLPELLHPGGNPYFWDAVVFLGQSILMVGLLLYSWIKNRMEA
ncbi:peptidase [Aquibacillus halophilus]|uniref:Peptidase n=1 Tax=Aquibacillus halophilus TaxID=930132 RepID=A0A6A8DFR4_9BACI|nr:peptidase [Aquibacillus halophilus]MRH44535.1 peptidase [Aquibacillus halophilus]